MKRLTERTVLILVFLLFSYGSWSQDTSTATMDTVGSAIDTTASAPISKSSHSPLKATIFSAVLPGAGQVYNKKYWKVPIIYAGFAGGGYAINFFNGRINQAQAAIESLRKGRRPGKDNFYNNFTDSTGLKEIKKTNTKRLHASIIGTSLWYVLNLLDAYVDAQLYEFDVSDDLSLQFSPYFKQRRISTGLTVTLNFD